LLGALASAFRIPELRKKILYTIGMLAVYRVASFIPVPGVNVAELAQIFGEAGLFQFLDLFAGGALMRFTVFAMGVGPYITSSIVMQLLQVVIPSFEEMAKSGVEGRKKLSQYTRYGAMILAVIQGTATTFGIRGALDDTGTVSVLLIIATLTAGTAFVMWLGEKISENGIGNGISLIIFTGIIARLPATFRGLIVSVGEGGVGIVSALLYVVISLVSIFAVVAITLANRRIPVQYAKRVVGRKVYGGQSTHIPLSVNQAGVIPVIFASSLLAFPATIAQFVPKLAFMSDWLQGDSVSYMIVYSLLIIGFTYFYTAMTFNVNDVSNNLKKYGGFIPGIRPGRPTVEYLERILGRLTFVGGLFLAVVAIAPNIVTNVTKLSGAAFGGTALLIMVGVALDTMKQIEAQLLMRQYEGFMK
jgi:preprotein translocase subunit SecY